MKTEEEYEIKDLKKEMIRCYTEMGNLLSDLWEAFEKGVKNGNRI